ncbi:hypothetical protein [Parachlamydia acanthamoebae]|uniref:hypothetical protein n=1 Tax=Parachlamydia acanthamoebae TaxID=83552 RepID=UPI0024E1D527|nr:hypothetical protein [Parachlamydia acanthamoebae]
MVKQPGFPIGPEPSFSEIGQAPINADGIVVERAPSSSSPTISMHKRGRVSLESTESLSIESISEESDSVDELVESVDRIKLLNHIGSVLSNVPPPTFSEWIKTNREAIIQDILFNQGHSFAGSRDATVDHLTNEHRILKELSLAGLLVNEEKKLSSEEIFSRLIRVLPETSEKNFLFYKHILNDEISSHVRELQKEYEATGEPHLKDQIDTLNHWLKKQHLDLKSSRMTKVEKNIEITGAALKIPLLFAVKALDFLRYADAAFSFVTLGTTNVFKLGFSIFDFVKAVRQKKIHKKWSEEFHPAPRVVDKTTAANLTKAGEDIDTLLQRRRKEEDRKLEIRRPEIEALIKKIDAVSTLEEAQVLLNEKGIRLEDVQGVLTLNALQGELQKPEVKEQLLRIHAKHQDAMQVSTRNAILTSEAMKSLSLKKKFGFNVKLNFANLFLTVVTVTTIIVLNILIIAAVITMPQFALAVLGVGFFVAAVILGGVGLFYFYRKSPHRFKEMIKGVNLRLGMYAIPSAYRNFFLKRKQQKQVNELASSFRLRVQIQQIESILKQLPLNPQKLPKELHVVAISSTPSAITAEEAIRYKKQLEKLEKLYQKKLHSYELRREKRAEKINRLERKVEFWNSKKEPLLEKLKRAGVADYLHGINLSLDRNGAPIELSKTIVEGMFTNPELLDRETVDILDRHFGIDVKKLQADGDPEIKKTVQKQLDDFFAINEKKFIKFIRKKMQEIKDEDQTTPVHP